MTSLPLWCTCLPLSECIFHACMHPMQTPLPLTPSCYLLLRPQHTPFPHSPIPFHCYYGVRRGVEHCLLQIMSLACCRYTIRPVRHVVWWARRAESRCCHGGSRFGAEQVPEPGRHMYGDMVRIRTEVLLPFCHETSWFVVGWLLDSLNATNCIKIMSGTTIIRPLRGEQMPYRDRLSN